MIAKRVLIKVEAEKAGFTDEKDIRKIEQILVNVLDSMNSGYLDSGGFFRFRDDTGIIEFAKGKWKGQPVEVQEKYLEWMISPQSKVKADTKAWAKRILKYRITV